MIQEFNFSKQCCFCGADNSEMGWGYAGERPCASCNHGGNGEPDLPFMACNGNLGDAPLSSLALIWRAEPPAQPDPARPFGPPDTNKKESNS